MLCFTAIVASLPSQQKEPGNGDKFANVLGGILNEYSHGVFEAGLA
jgi:hypothetical protein